MNYIQLTDEQFEACKEMGDEVQVRSPGGAVLGSISAMPPYVTPEFIADAVRRAKAPGPRYTTEQVIARCRALDALPDGGKNLDREALHAFLTSLDATDPPRMYPGRGSA
ncbi:MAG: hypothetical protein U0746_11450 [Gemmataceae bacterium]